MSPRIARSFCVGLLLAALASCKPVGENVASGQTGAQATPTSSRKKQHSAKLARIVFIDQEKCCACTRKRIDTSWKALMAVLGFPPTIPLDRYHLDTQEKQAEAFLSQRAIVAAPGIYFLDRAGNIIELLQGEVTEAQIRGGLSK
jgi:hypothetical protein